MGSGQVNLEAEDKITESELVVESHWLPLGGPFELSFACSKLPTSTLAALSWL